MRRSARPRALQRRKGCLARRSQAKRLGGCSSSTRQRIGKGRGAGGKKAEEDQEEEVWEEGEEEWEEEEWEEEEWEEEGAKEEEYEWGPEDEEAERLLTCMGKGKGVGEGSLARGRWEGGGEEVQTEEAEVAEDEEEEEAEVPEVAEAEVGWEPEVAEEQEEGSDADYELVPIEQSEWAMQRAYECMRRSAKFRAALRM